MATIVVFVAWIFSLCLHEFSHALVAYWGGDKSVKDKGYLTFNPLKYADPLLSVIYPMFFLLAGGIGMPGGCVYVDRSRLRSKAWECAVSLAGPFSNAFLAVVLSLPFMLGMADAGAQHSFWAVYSFLIVLQVSAVLLNLLPIPPLDGFGAIAPWLPGETRNALYKQGQIGMLLVFMSFWFIPFVNHTFWGTVYYIVESLGIPRGLAWDGYELFKIW
jgi:Zn-dependent protease